MNPVCLGPWDTLIQLLCWWRVTRTSVLSLMNTSHPNEIKTVSIINCPHSGGWHTIKDCLNVWCPWNPTGGNIIQLRCQLYAVSVKGFLSSPREAVKPKTPGDKVIRSHVPLMTGGAECFSWQTSTQTIYVLLKCRCCTSKQDPNSLLKPLTKMFIERQQHISLAL